MNKCKIAVMALWVTLFPITMVLAGNNVEEIRRYGGTDFYTATQPSMTFNHMVDYIAELVRDADKYSAAVSQSPNGDYRDKCMDNLKEEFRDSLYQTMLCSYSGLAGGLSIENDYWMFGNPESIIIHYGFIMDENWGRLRIYPIVSVTQRTGDKIFYYVMEVDNFSNQPFPISDEKFVKLFNANKKSLNINGITNYQTIRIKGDTSIAFSNLAIPSSFYNLNTATEAQEGISYPRSIARTGTLSILARKRVSSYRGDEVLALDTSVFYIFPNHRIYEDNIVVKMLNNIIKNNPEAPAFGVIKRLYLKETGDKRIINTLTPEQWNSAEKYYNELRLKFNKKITVAM